MGGCLLFPKRRRRKGVQGSVLMKWTMIAQMVGTFPSPAPLRTRAQSCGLSLKPRSKSLTSLLAISWERVELSRPYSPLDSTLLILLSQQFG